MEKKRDRSLACIKALIHERARHPCYVVQAAEAIFLTFKRRFLFLAGYDETARRARRKVAYGEKRLKFEKAVRSKSRVDCDPWRDPFARCFGKQPTTSPGCLRRR